VEEIPILGRGDEGHILKLFLAQYDVPAYIRRAQQVHAAYEALLGRCQRQRDEWLTLVRLRLGTLGALAGDWSRLEPWLAGADQAQALQDLHAVLRPRLRLPVEPTRSDRRLRQALEDLKDSIERFNRRWLDFLQDVNFTEVNRLRDGYNRYFVLEKECAVRSARLARQGFQPLEPLTREALTSLLPPLPVPPLRFVREP
jgi:hypothetical protein